MKLFFSIVLICTSFIHVNAQKIVKSTDFKLSDFEKLMTPSQIVGLKLNDDNKIMVYALKLIPGVVKAESTNPKPQKSTSKLLSALGDVSTFSGNDSRIGLPYISQLTFDINQQQTATEGELMLINAKEENMKYSFDPNFFANGITKKMEVKSSVKDLNQLKGISLEGKMLVKAGFSHDGKGLGGYKEAKAYFYTDYNNYLPHPNNGLIVFTKKTDTPNKNALSEKLPYVSLSTNTLALSKTAYQGIVAENKADDKWSSLKYFRLITVSNDGNLLNNEDMSFKYVRSVQDFMPLYNPNGEKKGSLIVFTKQVIMGNKDLKDPVEGNRNIFVSDENGKLWTKFDYQHAKGEGFQPFGAIAAMMKDDKLYVLNSNIVKLTNSLIETIVFDKSGKAEVTHSLSAEKPNPTVFGTVGTRKYVTEAVYQDLIKGENGAFFLIGQRYTSGSEGTGGTTPTPAMYGDIFVTELDADFKYKTHTIIALPNNPNKAKINILEQKAGKITIAATAKGGNDAVVLMDGSKVRALTDIMPIGMMHPAVVDWSNNYLYDASKNVIYFFYQSKADNNKAKIVTVSLVP